LLFLFSHIDKKYGFKLFKKKKKKKKKLS
jgi:hypothetical protein